MPCLAHLDSKKGMSKDSRAAGERRPEAMLDEGSGRNR